MPKKHIQSLKTRKRKGKDLDEILEDSEPAKTETSFEAARLSAAREASPDPDLAGDGQFFCTPCQRHFTDAHTLTQHGRTKGHKQRQKALRVPAYTQRDADAAAGLGSLRDRPTPMDLHVTKPPKPNAVLKDLCADQEDDLL